MKLLDGTVIDVQDDSRGEVLRGVFPEQALIPDSIKVAMPLKRLSDMEDAHFALVFDNEGQHHRKFACIDEGHTVLSAIYFMKTAHRLPREAQKMAAQGIVESCERYDLPYPAVMVKIANDEAYLAGDVRGVAVLPTEKAAGLLGTLASVGQKGLDWAVSNPGKALGTAMTGLSVVNTGSEIKNNLKNLSSTVGGLDETQGLGREECCPEDRQDRPPRTTGCTRCDGGAG